MKLIASGTVASLLTIDRAFMLMTDLNKIPLFRLEPVPTPHKNSSKLRFVVDDRNNIISLVSSGYVLTQPRETIQQLIKPFINEIESWKIYYGNGIVMARFRWENVLETNKIKFKPGILVRDSVTKMYRLKIYFAPYISECGNELLITRASFSRKHLGMVKYALEQFVRRFHEWLFNTSILRVTHENMMKEVLDKETFESIIKDLGLPRKYTDGIKWCNGYTLWQLYMDLTNKLTTLNAPIQYHVKVSKLTRI